MKISDQLRLMAEDWHARLGYNPQAALLSAAADALEKSQDFKDYVHQRLDAAGVPHSVPDSEHDKAGCRIGGRLDWIEARLKAHTPCPCPEATP